MQKYHRAWLKSHPERSAEWRAWLAATSLIASTSLLPGNSYGAGIGFAPINMVASPIRPITNVATIKTIAPITVVSYQNEWESQMEEKKGIHKIVFWVAIGHLIAGGWLLCWLIRYRR
jgi:hypothetical protein